MYARFTAPAALFAVAALLAVASAPAATNSSATPSASATPLKVIKHVYSSSRLCAGLKRSVGPAIGKILANDKTITASRPLLQDYSKSSSLGSQGGQDMAVSRLGGLIGPLVKGTQAVEQMLNDPVYQHRAQNENDKQLLQIRAQLKTILDQQKAALDLISGFVDTQQLGQLQNAGNEYNAAINGGATPAPASQSEAALNAAAPTAAPDPILNAGVSTSANDATGSIKNDPRLQTTGNALGYNPLNAFDQQMLQYQSQIAQNESQATITILKAVPVCGGTVPQPGAPAPSPAPAKTP